MAEQINEQELDRVWEKHREEANAAVKQVRTEPDAAPGDVWKNVFHGDADQRLARGGGV